MASACLHVVPDGDSSFAHGTTRAASLLVAVASVEGDCFGVAARDGPTFRPPDSVQRTAQHRSIETLPPLMALAAEAVQCSLLHTQNIVTPTSSRLGMGWWRPAARSRLVTGWSRRGAPFSVTAGHVAAGRVTAVTTPDQRPRPLPLATPESRAHGRSLAPPKSWSICGFCAARVAKPARAALRCPDGARLRPRRWSRTGRVAGHVPRATLRSRLRSKMSQGLQGPLPGSSASPLSAPGSCPGGGHAIGQ